MHPTAHGPRIEGSRLLLLVTALVGFGLLAFGLFVVFTQTAHADTINPPVVVDVPVGVTVSFAAGVVAIIQGTLTPILTGLLTKLDTSDGKQALVSFVIISIMAVCTQIISSPTHSFEIWSTLIYFATTLIAHIASFLQVWQPLKAGGNRAPLAGSLLS